MKRLILSMLLTALLLSGCQTSPQSYSETQFLLDTVCTIQAGGPDAKAAVQAAFSRIREVSDAVDFYSDTSTVAAFNRAGAGEAVPLDTHTAAVLDTALAVSRASGGAFDVTIAPVQALWPFHGEENPAPPAQEEITARLPLVGYDKLDFDPAASTLSKTRAGVEIDLSGAAKGYAGDQAVQALREAGAVYALLDLGGNVMVLGKNPSRPDGSWQVGIQTPFAPGGTYDRTLSVSQGAVVTSGTYQRGFDFEDRHYHHILDPATGYPADSGLSGVTITAESGLLADCLSTACLVLGEEKGRALAEQFGAGIYLNNETTKENQQ